MHQTMLASQFMRLLAARQVTATLAAPAAALQQRLQVGSGQDAARLSAVRQRAEGVAGEERQNTEEEGVFISDAAVEKAGRTRRLLQVQSQVRRACLRLCVLVHACACAWVFMRADAPAALSRPRSTPCSSSCRTLWQRA